MISFHANSLKMDIPNDHIILYMQKKQIFDENYFSDKFQSIFVRRDVQNDVKIPPFTDGLPHITLFAGTLLLKVSPKIKKRPVLMKNLIFCI